MKDRLKASLKTFFRSKPLLALWVARVRSLVLALPAQVYRIRFYLHASVPLSVKLIGAHRISMGKNTAIGAHSWLNVTDFKSKGYALEFGNHCFIGQDNFFTVGESTIIKDYCLTAKGCAFIGNGHEYENPMLAYCSTGIKGKNNIYIGVNCFFGFNARVIGNVTIGHGSVIGAGAEVREHVPPFSLVVGNPAKVIKRFDVAKKKWVKWPDLNYTEGPDEVDYLQQITKNSGAPVLHLSAAAGMLRDIG
jgi:acetyltransferase-like isoleucine patch superfamily enzyme